MPKLTFALCSYNRADRLVKLLPEMRSLVCPVDFEVLVVDNNSSDATFQVVSQIAATPGPPVRYVLERQQGIPYARNRALAEAMDSDFLVFIDDDELPHLGLLAAAVDALTTRGARCAGGKVKVDIKTELRPKWLVDDLLGFLAEVDYGDEAFWIKDHTTPVWTANIAYDMSLFRDDPDLRFDLRYNRSGHGVGGGSDAIMFKELLDRKVPMLYCPSMAVQHRVDAWRLHRRYFLKLHFVSGRKYGQFQSGDYVRTLFGVPPFMMSQAFVHWLRAAGMYLSHKPGALRQAMNGAHATGLVWGRVMSHLEHRRAQQTEGRA